MYKANCYVRINGKTYTRGETIQDSLPAGKIAWLVDAGAISEIHSSAPAIPDQAPQPAEAQKEEIPEGGSGEEDVEETEAVTEEESEEAPEIDVMAGIVAEEDNEPKKTAKKPAARKTAERRKGK